MKLFVTDYDGTLFVNEKDLKENIKMLKELQENNTKVIIATGRSYPSIMNQLLKYSIPYDYIIAADGSIIYDTNGNILKLYEMNEEIIEPFKKFYQEINYEEIQFVYKEGYSNILTNIKGLLGINVCIMTKNYTNELNDNLLKMKEIYKDYSFFSYVHPDYSYLCVKPKGITKATLITYLMDKLDITKDNIYVIGDSYNDYDMIKEYNGVAMTTSYPEILEIVNKTYSSVSDYIKDILN